MVVGAGGNTQCNLCGGSGDGNGDSDGGVKKVYFRAGWGGG